MTKTTLIISIILTLLILPITATAATNPLTERNTITVTLAQDGLLVEENLRLNNTGQQEITRLMFWIQQDATNIKLLDIYEGVAINPDPATSSHLKEYNLTNQNHTITSGNTLVLRLTYTLPTNTKNFEKKLQYDTTYITITFNDDELYQLQDTTANTHLRLLLYRPSETPLNLIYLIVIFLLVVLIIALTLLLFRKRQNKAKQKITESGEILSTKKQLLLTSLKDVEKLHRAKEISDETYTKLKDDYKQQAVIVMKKLDDLSK